MDRYLFLCFMYLVCILGMLCFIYYLFYTTVYMQRVKSITSADKYLLLLLLDLLLHSEHGLPDAEASNDKITK